MLGITAFLLGGKVLKVPTCRIVDEAMQEKSSVVANVFTGVCKGVFACLLRGEATETFYPVVQKQMWEGLTGSPLSLTATVANLYYFSVVINAHLYI